MTMPETRVATGARPPTAGGRLARLARLALAAGSDGVARDADALVERLREGRFYVACVGQFKRGKSTLINALVGDPVLPAGVVPITAAVTVVRHGPRLSAQVRFGKRDWEECDARALATFVSEEHNPGNQKGVTGVEVFVPSALLASGLCLVDTPGLGSVSAANTAATRAFVPHIDAALVVLGADPPISGEELVLVEEIARDVGELIVVLNKADRVPEADRGEAVRFTERVLSERLGKSIGPVLQVSAVERLARESPERDWGRLVERLKSLAREMGAVLVKQAEERGTAALAARLIGELDEEGAALQRPLEESAARIEALRRAVTAAEHSLDDLGPRLAAVQERLGRAFTEERDRFFADALPEAQRELAAAIRSDPAQARALRAHAIDHAIGTTRRWLDRWRHEQEPRVEVLYREGVRRFAELLDAFRGALTMVPELRGLFPRSGLDIALTARSRFFYTELLTVAPSSPRAWILDLLRTPARRRGAIEREASHYLERLLEVNSARIKNDFGERAAGSRRILEQEIRDRLHALVASAERALEQARKARTEGAAATEARLHALATLRAAAAALREGE